MWILTGYIIARKEYYKMAEKLKNMAFCHRLLKKASSLPENAGSFSAGVVMPDFDFMPENILVWRSSGTLRVTASSIHQRMILKVVLSGKCTMLIDGLRIVLKAGDMICLFPYQLHSTILECPREEYSFLAVTFMERNNNYSSFASLKYHVLKPDARDLIFLETIMDHTLSPEKVPREDLIFALLSILLHQRRKIRKTLAVPEGAHRDFFDRVCEYVRTHFTDPELNLNTLADQFQVSRESIRRSFLRANAGFSCGKLIEQLRMQLASELLEHSKEPVEEIAFRCGYNDPFTFSRAFKRVMGHSPARHRSGS